MLPPGVMIAAPRSGSGKTTMTLGLLRALKRRGLAVQPFKSGPDYIDPAFHAAASGRPSFNVDSWAMRWPVAGKLLADASHGSDIVVVESLMGLFDGVSQRGHWGNGASADLAAATGWPVILVLDVSGQSQTAAATARGFQNFQDGVTIAGVILNRVGSQRHVRFASEALEASGLPVIGALPRNAHLELPERHLGLVQAEETSELDDRLNALADFVEANVDIDRILQLARPGSIAAAKRLAFVRPDSASRSHATRRSRSSIRICWKPGARPAPKSCIFPRWPTRDPIPMPTSSGCPAAILNFTQVFSPMLSVSNRRSGNLLSRGRCMASAAAT